MSINLHLPGKTETLRPRITVVGVGGAGGNAVNNMVAAKLEGVNFIVANTDAQALDNSGTEKKIQLGANITRGLGAGANPDVGRSAAEEAMDEIAEAIEGSNMVFITAGMGGGTGTGAAPVVARLAREQGVLTVGVVTKPFHFEGAHRMRLAEAGLQELQQYVDTLIVIPNQNLFRIANEKTTFADAFRMADEVLHSGVRGVTDLMVKPGLVNLDFADIRTVMREMGKAMMGTGEATGDRRAIDAAEAAISNPLLDEVSLKGARAVLINITGGMDMTLYEVDEAANRIRSEVDPDANIIFGSAFNESMDGRMRVSVVATGIDAVAMAQPQKILGGATEPRRPYTIMPAAREQARPAPKPQIVAGYTPAPAPAPLREAPRPAEQPAAAARTQQGFDFPADATGEYETGEAYEPQADYAPAPAAAAPREPQLFSGAPAAKEPSRPAAAPKATEETRTRQAAPQRREESTGVSFFHKMTGLGKTAPTGGKPEAADTRPMQVSEKPRPEAADKAQATEEEYLDIPAFLRRQAN